MAPLPTPVTSEEQFLAAVHAELVGLRADMAAARDGERKPDPEPGTAELREPAPRPAKKATGRRKS